MLLSILQRKAVSATSHIRRVSYLSVQSIVRSSTAIRSHLSFWTARSPAAVLR